jgi:hypothetical protein
MRARVFLIGLILLCLTALGQRTVLKPGTGSDPANDIKQGLDYSKQIEKELTLVTNRDATTYVSTLGNKLVAKAPNPSKFPFTFKLVDDKEINAFALPGGPIYVNRGAIEAADNEAQIAGVIGHEIGHVILRHSAAQQKKGGWLGAIAGIAGSAGGDSTLGQIIGGGVGLVANLKMLKYSRQDEEQSDLMGTQILYDSGYDPKAMAEFFDKLAKDHKGSKVEQLFSNHPIPENRVAKVNVEIGKLKPPLSNPRYDTPDFQRVKKALLAMPAPKAKQPAAGDSSAKPTPTSTPNTPPQLPSAQTTALRIGGIELQHPANWKPVVNGTNITISPAGGSNDKGELAYGITIDTFTPQNARTLEQATDQFLTGLQRNNPSMRVVRSRVQTRVDGAPAQLTEFSSDSPFGGKETDVVVTVMRSATQMQLFVLVAPTKDMPQYDRTFTTIMNSVRLR